MKRFLSILLTLCLILPAAMTGMNFTAAAAEEVIVPAPTAYVRNGLVAWYDGKQNTRGGHDNASAVWEDLIHGYDLTVSTSSDCGFTDEGFHQKNGKSYFPEKILDTVNGEAFTVEILFSDFVSIGRDFNTFMNSDNDNFALFRRNSNDNLEFKFSGTAGANRPMTGNGLALLQNALITVTYKVEGAVIIYVNGENVAEKPCSSLMGADNLFIGHEGSKDYETTYRSMRFYNRELSPAEVRHNAAVDGLCSIKDLYVQDGLVSLFSGVQNTAEGYDPTASVWADLVSGNDLTLTLNDKNYFTREGFHLNSTRNYFNENILNVINGNAFTVEMYLGDLESLGNDFNTFLNSTNDAFSLFRRNSNNVLEFKFAANGGAERPVVQDGLETFANSLITVTYKVGGETVIYVDGVAAASKPSPKAMGANDFFLGHNESSRNYDTTFRALRFYDRDLTAAEVAANARADGAVVGTSEQPKTPGYVSIAQPKTPIAGDVALVRPVDSASELNAVCKQGAFSPAAVILTLNASLQVVNASGAKIDTLDNVLDKLGYTVIPVFAVKDQKTVNALAEYLKSIRFYDCAVMSADAELILAARKLMPQVRGVIDYTETYKDKTTLTKDECIELRKSIHSHMGTVAVLPQACARTEVVQYLYDQIVNVWVRAADQMTAADHYDTLLSGAIGIITDDCEALYATAAKLPSVTMSRMPLNIGHRGIPSGGYPENTLEGAIAAYEAGADVIEIDIYLTTDKEIVIMHDGSSGRTCNRDLGMETSTLAQLKELYVNKGFENKEGLNKCRIPTLREYLEYFKNTDCAIFIEIKSGKADIVPIMKALIEEYDMYAQCAVITFSEAQMANMMKYYPEMSVGALCSGYMGEANPDSDSRNLMNFIGKYNATLNPNSGGYGANAIRAALLRGIAVYPWTFDGASYNNYLTWGYSGLTGNSANTMARDPKKLTMTAELPETLSVGDVITLKAETVTYKRDVNDVTASTNLSFMIVDGSDAATLDGNKLTITGSGDVAVVAVYSFTRSPKYTLVTQPMILHVEGAPAESDTEAETVTGADPVVTDPADTTGETLPGETTDAETDIGTAAPGTESETQETASGCKSALSAALLLVLSAGAVVTVRKKKD